MDPIYYQVNTNRKQENTLRQSDSLRVQQTKEREKPNRPGPLDDSDLSADVGSMSGDDLLGSMDPDLFGAGGGAEAFQQMWEEVLAEDEEELFDDGEQGEEDEEEEGHPQEPPQDEVQEEEGRPPLQAFRVTSDQDAPPAVPPRAPEAATEPAPPMVIERQPKRAPTASLETVDLSKQSQQAIAPPEKTAASAPVKVEMPAFSSLLDHTGGFLLAQEVLPEAIDDPLPDEPESEPPMAPELAELLERLIVGDSQTPSYRKLQHLLARFGKGVLRTCLAENARVYLLPRGAGLNSHPLVAGGAMKDARGAVYLTNTHSCVVEEECLLGPPNGFHPVFFYFAHAFDHALGGEDFASLRSPAVQASFQACQFLGQFADPLAAASPVHYFAQSVASYLDENDCLEPLWTRFDLYDFDRSMFEYVDYLFKRANK